MFQPIQPARPQEREPGWFPTIVSTAAGLLQGLTGNRQEQKNRALQREQLMEQRRQFDTRFGEDRRQFDARNALDQRELGLREGQDQRRASGLEATAGNRQAMISNLLRRLGVGA